MATQAVVFDLFGTLIPNLVADEYRRVTDAMAACVGAPPDDFARIYGSETWHRRATGVLGRTEDAIAYTCRSLGLPSEEVGIAKATRVRLDLTRRSLRPLPGAIETLTVLRDRGYKVGLISDCSAEVPLLWPGCLLAPLIDAPVFSCAAGVKKPDPRIYAICCEQLQVRSRDCLYVADGSEQELSGALAAGMQAVLVRVPFAEATNPDRPEASAWQGLVIDAIPGVLHLLDRCLA
jgi:putative hydrolase of the HAD superfamily